MRSLGSTALGSMCLLVVLARPAAGRECELAAHPAGGPARVTIVLDFTLPPGISTRIAQSAVAEADAIWSRYAVDIVISDSAGCAAIGNAVHLAVIPGAQRAGETRAPLGAVHFAHDGIPDPVITVFYEELVQFSSARSVLNPREMEYPSGKREQVAGRVLGRVLAHELGHYLLRWPLHGDSGLMRATQWTPELSTGATTSFLLSANEAARLAGVLGRTHPALSLQTSAVSPQS